MLPQELPIVAIIGRENVGKSTLFNRLTEKQQALISKIPGTTRDRNYGICFWQSRAFNVVDTGGFNAQQLKTKITDQLEAAVFDGIQKAIDEATAIIFVLDGQETLTEIDKNIVRILRTSGKPVFLTINKLDNPRKRRSFDSAFERLEWKEQFLISAINGVGVGDLLEAIVKKINPPLEQELNLQTWTRIAIMGRPNVGKSSLTNAILGDERAIVSDQPHTTRAPQDIYFTYKGRHLLLIDTAGLRRQAKVNEELEKNSAELSKTALDNCDVVLYVLPANEPIGHQDKHLLGEIISAQKSVIILANKFDLAIEGYTVKDYEYYLRSLLPSFDYIPALCVSAKNKTGIDKILPLAIKVAQARDIKIEQKELSWILDNAPFTPPTKKKPGIKLLKVQDLQQWGTRPPYFIVVVNEKHLAPPALADIIKKALRQKYKFIGTPINVYLKNGKDI